MKNKYCDEFRTFVSPLHDVIAKGSNDMVMSVLKRGHRNLNSLDSAGQTPLYYAIFRGYRFGINKLLDCGSRINIKDNDGNTPLHFAVKKGNINIVSDLLKRGADLEQSNKYGQTVLQYAIVWNYSKTFEPLVELLLNKGARVDVTDKDMETPLHSAAARRDSKSVCLLLLARGANICARDKKGNTPLHIASMKQCKEAILTLIEMGADIDGINNLGDTPLHIAVKSKVPESLKLLIAHKADINAKNCKSKSALHLATKLGSCNLMKILLDSGASLEETDYKGNTALHCAAKSYHSTETSAILLERGASTNIYNCFDESPLHLALQNTSKKTTKIILDWGTTINSMNYINLSYCRIESDQFEVCMNHCVKLRCANIDLELNCFESGLPWNQFLNDVKLCAKELEKMKAERFGRNSLYRVLSNYSDPTYLLNNELKAAITSPNLESRYPIYGSLLKITLKKAEKRFELLNEAQNSLRTPLPEEIQRKVLAYLDEGALLSVIKAFQSS